LTYTQSNLVSISKATLNYALMLNVVKPALVTL